MNGSTKYNRILISVLLALMLTSLLVGCRNLEKQNEKSLSDGNVTETVSWETDVNSDMESASAESEEVKDEFTGPITIREKALKLLDEEIPHGIYIEVEKMNLRNTSKGEEIYDVEAIIYTLRNSHKGIIIGKNGTMLKKIATYARQDLEKMLQTKINLKVWVKVKENWQDNSSIVKKFENK